MTNELVKLFFDEGCDAFAASLECCIESLFGLIIEIVTPLQDGVSGNLWMIHADDSD